jgi:hypothetical protein
MIQLLLVVVIAVLWLTAYTEPGGTDFMRVTVFKAGFNVIRVQDMMIGLVLVCMVIAMRGPLAFTSAALLVIWAMNLFGVPQLFGVEVLPVVVIVLMVGVCVHFVTQRDH